MNQPIRFQQIIRTSSQVRRGFRTYQRSSSVNKIIEEKLSSYSVYSPTVYMDVSSISLEEYPVMFMYCILNNKKVFCKSVYLGLDRHSFPPRAGNYITHAIVYGGNEIFNPVEIYEKAKWKTGDEVNAEDGHNADVKEFIDDMDLLTDIKFLDTKWFEGLIVQGSGERSNEAMANRKEMFCMAVDSILNGKKVIIIDRKEMLLKWTMTLFQVFPPEYVFEKLHITSFANSSLLLDVCNVLCFETENAETAQRYSTKAALINFDNPVEHKPSGYASAVLHAIESGGLAAFRTMVYPKITGSVADDFNKAALFYENLAKVADMQLPKFTFFIQQYIRDKTCMQAIFEELKRSLRGEKCAIIWKELASIQNIWAYDLSYYQYIATFTLPDYTNEAWVEFESQVAAGLRWKTLDEINNFFKITSITHPKRDDAYFEAVMAYITHEPDIEKINEGIKSINNIKIGLSEEQKARLQKLDHYFGAYAHIKNENNKIEAYARFREVVRDLDQQQVASLTVLLEPIGWQELFSALQDRREFLQALYKIPVVTDKLPQQDLAEIVLNDEYKSKRKEFFELYRNMSDGDKAVFDHHAPLEIKEVIVSNLPIGTLGMAEAVCNRFKDVGTAAIIDRLITTCKDRKVYDELWELCKLPLPESTAADHPQLKNRLKNYKLDEVYALLDDVNISIPPNYDPLAVALQKSGKLKRYLPKNEMALTLAFLRSVGQYEDIEKIKPHLQKQALTTDMLYELIKLPWSWYDWGKLFELLNEENRENMHVLLSSLREYPGKKGWKNPNKQWRSIICEYAVFLIKENHKELFGKLEKQSNFPNEERIYIAIRVLNITTEYTELYEKFVATIDSSGWTLRGFFGRK